MTSKAEKLLKRMQQSTTGWGCADLLRLYSGFGFIIVSGSKHDIIKHPRYPHLRTTLPRHTDISNVYVKIAIDLIAMSAKLDEETGKE